MADVFLGRDRLLDRQVAIKVLFPEFAIDPNFVERFRREAQAAANLSHPNIVNVYDWGRHSGTYFIAMEYVDGRTLAEILRTNGHVTSKQAAEIASEVAAALGFAHQAGLVHRDVKPANILIGSNGQVKVADFGIARAMNSPTESNLTQAGAVMGTATYFSPEQAQGAQPDPRSDLYSLGIVMYEMVAGHPPFTGENPVSIAYKQVHDHPQPLNQIVSDIPRPYEAIVAKLLAKDPKVRYTSAEALRDDLRRFRNGDPVLALAAASERSASTTVAPAVAGAAGGGGSDRGDVGGQPADGRPSRSGPGACRPGRRRMPATTSLRRRAPAGTRWRRSSPSSPSASAACCCSTRCPATTAPAAERCRNYVNMPLPEVIADLDERGLKYEPIAEENSTVPELVVFRTDPVAGTIVVDNQVIRLYYNPNPELQEVPNVEGQPLRRRPAHPQLGRVPDRADHARAERLDRRRLGDPHGPGGRDSGSPRRRRSTSSCPRDRTRSPCPPTSSVCRRTRPASCWRATRSGSRCRRRQEESDAVAEGLVIRTSPGSGELVDVGASVQLVVSSGAPGIEVPNVVGNTENAARDVLAQFDVDVSFEELDPGDSNDGRVLSQSISPGQLAPAGTTIDLVIGQAADPPPPNAGDRPTHDDRRRPVAPRRLPPPPT